MYTSDEISQGRKDARLKTYCFFLDVQKAYDTPWKTGLWKKLWELGSEERRRMMKKTTECARSAVMLDGKILSYVYFYNELHRDVRYVSPNLLYFKVNSIS